MSYIPCMGGWGCVKRERCALYHSQNRAHPVERLCEPGEHDRFEVVRVVPARWLDVVEPIEVLT